MDNTNFFAPAAAAAAAAHQHRPAAAAGAAGYHLELKTTCTAGPNKDKDDDDEEEEGEEEANTQETFTQQLTQGNELTQLGGDDDDDHDDDDDAGLSQSRDCHSPLTPIDPLTLPWGRLMPVGAGMAVVNDDGHASTNDNAADDNNSTNNTAAAAGLLRPSSRGPTELLPRMPTWASGSRSDIIATRSRSPSVALLNGGSGDNYYNKNNSNKSPMALGDAGGINNQHQQFHSPTPRINFLGLKNLVPSDRFNEYVMGRSVKADVTAQKLDWPTTTTTTTTTIGDASSAATDESESQKRNDAKRKRHEYVHAMVSNRHCRIYCLLSNVNHNNNNHNIIINNNNNNNNNMHSNTHSNNNRLGSLSSPSSLLSMSPPPSSSPPDMEVFVEDTSGNGTLINGTTLLRKNERRRLHTGDVICLLNPKLLSKKLRSVAERKMYMSQYSYVFVNLYEQEARHGWGIGMTGSTSAKPNKGRKKTGGAGTGGGGVVNVRAIKCHSINQYGSNYNSNNSNSNYNSMRNGGGTNGESIKLAPTQYQHQQQLQSSTSRTNNNGIASSSLGSFLNNPRRPLEDTTTSNNHHHKQQHHRPRRIEEEYDLRDLLGTGTCGEVRRAIHRRTGEERAVKIITIDGRGGVGGGGAMPGMMSSEKLASIQAEADILRSLDHPYVVKLFDAYISPGKAIYLVMELIRGGDLFDRIVERERYTEVQARRLFRRILAAVHYLHEERGIVHRDLKPENILVVDRRSDVNIKLTDFGLAKNMTAEGLKTFCGTPQYFAPEVLRRRHTVKGDGRYGKEIDCWSIGVILFILLSGSPPFDVSAGFDAVASARLIFHEDQWNTVSREARDLVKRLLEKDPRRRMSVRDACRHAWMLVDDGDTHCHPLHDPLIARDDSMMAVDAAKVNVSNNEGHRGGAETTIIDEKCVAAEAAANPPLTSSLQIRPPVDADTVNHDDSMQMCQEKSMPMNISNDERRPSLWSSVAKDKTVTKAIQQACHTSRPSPTGSPIQQRQLFDEPSPPTTSNNISTCKKRMSKRGMESIMAAGKSLPPPVINKESLLVKKADMPKKKIQSTLFPPTDVGEEQAKTASLPKKVVSNRKSGTSTVTPPGTEQHNNNNNNNNNCGLVFRLNKKQKVGGKYISPEIRQSNVTNAKAVINETLVEKKTELSEDELQSDFSDQDDEDPAAATCGNSSRNAEKKPLEKYLHKRKMESIDSIASVDIESKPRIMHRSSRDGAQPRPVSKSSEDGNSKTAEIVSSITEVKPKSKEKKFIQTCLFGKPPLNLTNDVAGIVPDGPNNIGSDPSQAPHMHPGDGTAEPPCQSAGESIGGGVGVTSAASKGKQRSITSWLVK